MSCRTCGKPLTPGAPLCAWCGTAVEAAQPTATSPLDAPYPVTHVPPKIWGWWHVAVWPVFFATVTALPILFSKGRYHRTWEDNLWGAMISGVFSFVLFGTIAFAVIAAHNVPAAKVRALLQHGMPCLGRIRSMGMVTTITTSYQQATFSLDLYRANIATPHGYREGAGHQPLGSFEVVRPIARRGVSGVSAEHLHMAQVKEGSWCALIVDPNNPSRYLLDGFFAPNGSFVKLFDEQVLLHQPI